MKRLFPGLRPIIGTATTVALTAALLTAATAPAHAANHELFTYTGTESTYTVPADLDEITLQVVGAGGTGNSSDNGGTGGDGAGVTFTQSVAEGDTLTFRVGGAGQAPASAAACAGGSATAVLLNGLPLAVAGGGGASCGGQGGSGASSGSATGVVAGADGLEGGRGEPGKGGNGDGGNGAGAQEVSGISYGLGGTSNSPNGEQGLDVGGPSDIGGGGGSAMGGDGGGLKMNGTDVPPASSASFTQTTGPSTGGGGAGFGAGGAGATLKGPGGGGGYGGGGGGVDGGGGAGGSYVADSATDVTYSGPASFDGTDYGNGGAQGSAQTDRSGKDGVVAILFVPKFEADPNPVAFGDVPVDSEKSETVTIKNSGQGEYSILDVAISDFSGSFAVNDNQCGGVTLAADESCEIEVGFKPVSDGSKSGSLQLTTDLSTPNQSVPLSGTGLPKQLVATPNPLDFDEVEVGQSSNTLDVTVTNQGNVDIPLGDEFATISGTNSDLFAIENSTCSGATLAATEECTITLKFTPDSRGTKGAKLDLTPTDPFLPQSVALRGKGIGPSITVEPGSIDYSLTPLNTPSSHQVTITSDGESDLVLGQDPVTVTGDNAGQYSVDASDCANKSLANGDSCNVEAIFTPTSGGSLPAQLQITSNAADSPTPVDLDGVGAAPSISFDYLNLSFGDATVNSESGTLAVTATNDGSLPLVFEPNGVSLAGNSASEFEITSDTCSDAEVAPNAECEVAVKFEPTSKGDKVAQLTFTTNAPSSPDSVALTGRGIQGGISANPSPVNFGSHKLATSTNKTVTVTNSGNIPLVFEENAIALDGANAGQFSLKSETCSSKTLEPNAKCEAVVGFKPTATQAYSAKLVITSNAPNSPLHVSVMGSGQAAPTRPLKVTVKGNPKAAKRTIRWNPPAAGGAVSRYHIVIKQRGFKRVVLSKHTPAKLRKLVVTKKQLLRKTRFPRTRGEARRHATVKYRVWVYATNSTGTSPASSPKSFKVKY